jgi:hypothetical protein
MASLFLGCVLNKIDLNISFNHFYEEKDNIFFHYSFGAIDFMQSGNK